MSKEDIHYLCAQTDPQFGLFLVQTERRMLELLREYKGDDPLYPWIMCVKWVQELSPLNPINAAALIVLYKQLVRPFIPEFLHKDDLRFVDIWLSYAANRRDAEKIYTFMEQNQIGQGLATFYSSYALYMERHNHLRLADCIFNRGINRKVLPLEPLVVEYRSFLSRSIMGIQLKDGEGSSVNKNVPVRTFAETGGDRKLSHNLSRRAVLGKENDRSAASSNSSKVLARRGAAAVQTAPWRQSEIDADEEYREETELQRRNRSGNSILRSLR